jgi:eukaryotic-like serine/threonine-protein kinase
MGRVWVARELGTGTTPRLLAVKTTLSADNIGAEFWNLLLDEARIASQVQHPNVCSIHAFEVDEPSGVPYVVMDWSDGGSLHELLALLPKHVLACPIAAYVAARVCDGLHVAHELPDETGAPLGVVHRDVSPQNILISASGHVRLTDFGVAKARGSLHTPTETGEIKGKLSYMAPEQVTTRLSDRRADVFATGCVLYEATVGERPFHGVDAMATLYRLLEEPLARPSERIAGYPPGLEEIVIKALEREPDARYQSAEEMSRALEGWLALQGQRVSERDLSELVRAALGTKITERNRQIEVTIRELDAPPVVRSEPTLAGSVSSKPQRGGLGPRRTTLALTALVVSLGLLGLWLITRTSRSPSRNGQAELAPTSAASSVQPATGGVPSPTPTISAAPPPTPSSTPSEVSASTSASVKLWPIPPTRPRAGAGASSSSPDRPLKPGELPAVVKKPPRSLDTNNPFSNP